ncbi:unnamed protein product [Allacma fusca]|uniref:Rad51-like C-terminal domain-containing protein n=1 Tax=Allacma fusca TaxID=39272 RepID=A0A8J2PNC0_9HEXA|nr:unnamed protein product [Allacma fusca]
MADPAIHVADPSIADSCPPSVNDCCRLLTYKEISKESLAKLEENDITTVTDLFLKTPETILTMADMTHLEYEKLTNEIFLKCRPEVTTFLGALHGRGQLMSTGFAKLHELILPFVAGVLYCKSTSVRALRGKTQMCLSIAALVSQGEEDISLVYLDLKNDFEPLRFQELCKACNEKIDRIRVYRESKVKDVINILENFESKLSAANTLLGVSLRLIIIDSLPMMFYPSETDYDDFARICQERVFQNMKRISARLGVAIIMTNHAVVQDFNRKRKTSAGIFEQQQRLKPALGAYWIDVPNFRVYLASSGECNEFSATLCKSTRTEEGQTFSFQILDAGLR